MNRVIDILSTVNRPGMDRVIEYLRTSNYSTASCCTHHIYQGGLLDHSLEVYDLMMKRRGSLPEDSVAICALLHDLDKAESSRKHSPRRVVAILDKCGFQLTEDERYAIVNHHETKKLSTLCNPLRRCLSGADMTSTGAWKTAHPAPNESACKRAKNILLYELSKISIFHHKK